MGVVPVGMFCGLSAIIVELAHCNLRCKYCNVNFDHVIGYRKIGEILHRMANLPTRPKTIVLTGGEPFLYDLSEFIGALVLADYHVIIETNGSLAPRTVAFMNFLQDKVRTGYVSIVMSPKTTRVSAIIRRLVAEYNYILDPYDPDYFKDGLPSISTQPNNYKTVLRKTRIARPLELVKKERIYITPMYPVSKTPEDWEYSIYIARTRCLKHGYRLSLPEKLVTAQWI